jgi:hypothetical protein
VNIKIEKIKLKLKTKKVIKKKFCDKKIFFLKRKRNDSKIGSHIKFLKKLIKIYLKIIIIFVINKIKSNSLIN